MLNTERPGDADRTGTRMRRPMTTRFLWRTAGLVAIVAAAAQCATVPVLPPLPTFEEKLRYDASKQQTIDRLYSELQGYRTDLVARAARPFIFGMIHHHAEIGKLLAGLRATPDDDISPTKFGRLLESLQEDVADVLAENGVTAYRAEASDPFDPVRQTVVGKATPTTEEDRSGTIAACLGPGFEHEGRILVKARVSAYRCQPTA